MELDKFTDLELIDFYGKLIKELKNRKIIRTKNVIGDLGERLAIDYYTSIPKLPVLQDAPTGTQNIDAISRAGERYSIKSLTGKTTGVFYGLPVPESNEKLVQKFEYLIIVKFNDDYELEMILELNWEQFLLYKKWHSRMLAWNITLNRKLINDANLIYSKDK